MMERVHLKAIRESILQVRMNDWLQLPKEGVWLENLFDVFVNALRSPWRTDADIPSVEARSNWVLDQIDVYGWTHRLDLNEREDTIKSARTRIIFALIAPLPSDVPPDIQESYWRWVEKSVLIPVKEFEPDIYSRIINLIRKHISEFARTDITEWEPNDE